MKIRPLLLILAGASPLASAVDLYPEASVGVIGSDNVARTDTGRKGDVVGVANVGGTYIEQASQFQADVDAQYTHRKFFNNTFSDQDLGLVRSIAAVQFIPDHLGWSLEDNYGQISIQPFDALDPSSLQNINYVTTGPNATFDLGSRTRVQIDGQYSQVWLQRDDTDNRRFAGQLEVDRQLSGHQHLALDLFQSRTLFMSDRYPAYDTRDATLSFTSDSARSSTTLRGGIVELYNHDNSNLGSLFELQYLYRLTQRVTGSLYASHGLSDAGDTFRFDQINGSPDTMFQNVVDQADPFRRTLISGGLAFAEHRTSIGFGVTAERDRYTVSTFSDRDILTGEIDLSRKVSPRTDLTLIAYYETSRQIESDEYDHDLSVQLTLDHQMSRAWHLQFQVEHFRRSTNLAGENFPENRATVALVWSPRGVPQRVDSRGIAQRAGVNGLRSTSATGITPVGSGVTLGVGNPGSTGSSGGLGLPTLPPADQQ